LKRGVDPAKDQTYFLFNLKQEQLKRALFPLGGLTKGEVRERARALGLKVAEKGESQEICFIPQGGHATFLKERFPEAFRTGPILNEAGERLGTHRGLPGFTVGQRRGLGISSKRPLYVLKLDPERNTLTVGPRESLRCEGFTAEGVSWTLPPPPRGREALVQVRYRRAAKPAYLKPLDGGRVKINFLNPEEAVAPGQAAAFFDGDLLLGGGWISR
ncbi:MAG: MnmA/TRMU family protein, partial [Nitrospinota bacterium]